MPALGELGYSTKQVSRLLGLRPQQIRRFVEAEILEPEAGEDGEAQFSFRDLVLLRAAKGLSDAKVPPRKIRSALLKLRRRLPEKTPAAGVRIAAHGTQVVVRDGSSVWDPESGQELFDFALEELAAETEMKAAPARGKCHVIRKMSTTERARESYDRACELEATSPDEGRRLYLRALELDPDFVDAHLDLGRLLHESGELAEAVGHYQEALRVSPHEATAAFNLGVALEDLGRDEDALAAYEQAIVSDDRCVDAYFNASRLLEEAGNKGRALRYLKEYRRLGAGA